MVDGDMTYTLDQSDVLDEGPDPDILECDKEMPSATDCRMSRIMYKWNGTSYDPYDGITMSMEGSLAPHETFWVKAFKEGIALRSPTAAAAAAATAESSTQALSVDDSTIAATQKEARRAKPGKLTKKPNGWFVRLIASSEGKQDRGNVLGQLSDSSNGLDRHDLATLAPFNNSYLDILFTNPLLGDADWGFASDYRALTSKPTGAWPFVVRASADVGEVTLSWEGEKTLFKKAWLLDEQSGKVYAVDPGGSYTFIMDASGESYFTIRLE